MYNIYIYTYTHMYTYIYIYIYEPLVHASVQGTSGSRQLCHTEYNDVMYYTIVLYTVP